MSATDRGVRARLRRALASQHLPVAVAMVALAMALPSLGTGFILDDFTHAAALRPELGLDLPVRGAWDIFRFQDADTSYLLHNRERGIWPWWTSIDFRLAFFRPLASFWHAFDHRVLGERLAWVMHLESALLYAALAAVAALVYRRVMAASWMAGLAALLYAIDHGHAFVVFWIANRNALLAAFFGLSSLLFHLRAREERRPRAMWAATVTFALALASSEAAVGVLGYLVAYALGQPRGARLRELRAGVPLFAVMLAYTVVYVALGYGARGGATYIDPIREPFAMAKAAAVRGPLLLVGQVVGPPPDVWGGMPEASLPFVAAGAAVALWAFARIAAPSLARASSARFFALGAVLSTIPVTATQPSDRLLLFPSFGVLGLVALLLGHAKDPVPDAARLGTIARRALAGVLVFVHLGLSPLLFVTKELMLPRVFGGVVRRADASLPRWTQDEHLVVLNATDALVPSYVMAVRALRGEPLPKNGLLLSVVLRGSVTVTREDRNTLVLDVSEGILHDVFSRIFRSDRDPLRPGEVVPTNLAEITVLETNEDGKPTRIRYHFTRPLDDPSVKVVTWEDRAFVAFALPAVGETVVVPTVDYGRAMAPD